MAITINKSEDSYEGSKIVHFTIGYEGKDYKWHGNMPSDADAQEYWDAKEDELKHRLLKVQYRGAVVPQLDGKSALESFEAWVSAGAKNAEVKQEIPAIKAKAAVYEDVEVEPAKDAVMGERQKELSEEEEVTKTVIEKSDSGKYLEKEVTETVVKKIPQYEEVPLYAANGKAKKDEDGNAVMHSIPKMEEYEVEPAAEAVIERRLVSEAVEAVAKQEIIIKPEAVIEKKAWVDSH